MLVVCKICGAEIEEDAIICPMCGHENILKEARTKGIVSIIMTSLITIVLIALMLKSIISS